MKLLAVVFIIAPAMLLSWGLAQWFTTFMPQHPWRDEHGKFTISYEDWCKHASPELLEISLCLYLGFVMALCTVLWIWLRPGA